MNGPLQPKNGPHGREQSKKRGGAVVVLAAVLLIVVLAMTAFAVDLGYIAVTKTQMRSAADASALAGAIELSDGLGMVPFQTPFEVLSNSSASATTVAALQRNGDQASTYLDSSRDIRFGQVTWNSASGKWVKSWGTTPYNLIGVTAHRDQDGSGGDSRLPLFFANVLGYHDTSLQAGANAAILPGVGIRIAPGTGNTADILPIALDDPTWTALTEGVGTDEYAYDHATGTVSPGSDGVLEINLYPQCTGSPGNRGTVNIGTNNNSTSNLQRQIEFGLNDADLAPYGGQLRTDNGPLMLIGNPGISAALKSSLLTIVGKPRLIPIFTNLTGNGANAQYTIPKFVGIRVLHVELTGGDKKLVIQPAVYSSRSVIPGAGSISTSTYFTKPRLMQ